MTRMVCVTARESPLEPFHTNHLAQSFEIEIEIEIEPGYFWREKTSTIRVVEERMSGDTIPVSDRSI